MMLPTTLLTLLTLTTTTTLAQTTVQNLFFANPSNSNAFAGSVVAVSGSLTTYAVACTSGTQSCYTDVSVTITEGPSTLALTTLTVTAGVTASVEAECNVDGTTSATCTEAVSISANGQSTAVTTTTTLGTADFNYKPVTITAGVEKLASGSAGATATGNVGNVAAPQVTGMAVLGAVGLAVAALL